MTFNRRRDLARVKSALDERHHLIKQKALKLINRDVPAVGGNFGYVHRAKWTKPDGNVVDVAVKTMKSESEMLYE